jgi:F0F1-type ATP synthase membrane subunit b/b'
VEGGDVTTIFAFAENAIQLVPDGTLLLHLLIVVGMVVLLNGTLFRPINKVLEERESQTKGRLNEAQGVRQKLHMGLLEYDRGLREARLAAYQFIETVRAEALSQREKEISAVKEAQRTWISNQVAEIEHQVDETRKILAAESTETAVRIGSQILHRPVDSRPRI